MGRILAISDIHGCGVSFDHLISKQIKLRKTDELYLLGDYIDRGKNSMLVIDIILELIAKGYKVVCLRGNHEDAFIETKNDEGFHDHWSAIFGGATTLKSFGVEKYEDLDEKYKYFFEKTLHYFETSRHLFVHAGLNFNNDDIFEDKHSMLWMRGMKVNLDVLNNRKIIHGHTPRKLEDLKQIIQEPSTPVFNIDTGCAYSQITGMGHLTAIELTKKKLFYTENID